MHAEEQIEQPVAPEMVPQANSTPIKKQHGGRRPGAGRKPNYAKRLLSGVKPMTAAEALEGIDVKAVVHDLLKNGSRPVKLQTLTVLWDRIYGKPKQEIGVSGGLLHAHTRDPQAITDEERVARITRKLVDKAMEPNRPPGPLLGPEGFCSLEFADDLRALPPNLCMQVEEYAAHLEHLVEIGAVPRLRAGKQDS